ncbi:hypothetical protein QWZ13_12645 [Reinekea marina]|uniref:hypothetical protein n=1 Tax=Reinekea marina TaxID=1310421 RepID=UPI0025B2E503|nr:hypothetical protein [Reinekea marina]MDN3649761.1 hypothetical protein [Reinekea marina]
MAITRFGGGICFRGSLFAHPAPLNFAIHGSDARYSKPHHQSYLQQPLNEVRALEAKRRRDGVDFLLPNSSTKLFLKQRFSDHS